MTGRIDLYDTTTWTIDRQLQTGIELLVGIKFSTNGSRIAVSGDNGQFVFLDNATGQVVALYDKEVTKVWALCFAPDNSKLAMARTDGPVFVVTIP